MASPKNDHPFNNSYWDVKDFDGSSYAVPLAHSIRCQNLYFRCVLNLPLWQEPWLCIQQVGEVPPQLWGGLEGVFWCRLLSRLCTLATTSHMSVGKFKRQLLYSVPQQTTALPKAHKWTTQIEDLRGSSISAQKPLNIIVQRLTVSKSLWNHWNAPIRWCHGGHLHPAIPSCQSRQPATWKPLFWVSVLRRPLEIYHYSEEYIDEFPHCGFFIKVIKVSFSGG